MQACQVCGKQNPAGVEYCEDCGAALSGGGKPTAGNQPTAAESTAPVSAGGPSSPPSLGASPPSPPSTGVPPSPPSAPLTSSAPPTSPPPPTGGDVGGVSVPVGGSSGTPAASVEVTVVSGAAPASPPVSAPSSPVPDATAPPAVGTGPRPRLVAKAFGTPTGDEIPLLAERLVVGRFDPETGPVDVDLSSSPGSEHISRQHGELYREVDGRWFVRDLGSTNGVFVKGEAATSFGPRISAAQPLAQGDEIAFGNARFVFRTD